MSSPAAPTVRLVNIDPAAAFDVLGITVTPLVGTSETAEHFGFFCASVPPGAGIPVHTHPDVELFFILEGEVSFLSGKGADADRFTAHANQGGIIPMNEPHGFLNSGEGTARVLITCTKNLECFFLEAGRPLEEAAKNPKPSAEEIGRVLAIAHKWGQVFDTH